MSDAFPVLFDMPNPLPQLLCPYTLPLIVSNVGFVTGVVTKKGLD
jgi:hypothetical protein